MKQNWLDRIWYDQHHNVWLLRPFAWIYQVVAWCRRRFIERFKQQQLDVPVIVVGNISVGGVGKTPLVVALALALKERGFQVGIVSRGYGATIRQFPHEIQPHDLAVNVGDEPYLLAQKTACPVVISPNRVEAARYLLAHHPCQVIISDDGLQHYALGRSIEIAVVDGERGFGNGQCLPAGPLREKPTRLRQVDFIVVNGSGLEHNPLLKNAYRMTIEPGSFRQLSTNRSVSKDIFATPVAAVAGIGNPQRFFATLDSMEIAFTPYAFADHHPFQKHDFINMHQTIVMTEKDAVKCAPFASDQMYSLSIDALLPVAFWNALMGRLV